MTSEEEEAQKRLLAGVETDAERTLIRLGNPAPLYALYREDLDRLTQAERALVKEWLQTSDDGPLPRPCRFCGRWFDTRLDDGLRPLPRAGCGCILGLPANILINRPRTTQLCANVDRGCTIRFEVTDPLQWSPEERSARNLLEQRFCPECLPRNR